MTTPGLEDLFRRHGRRILRRASAILGDRDAAKDVMQDVFVRAMSTGVELSSLRSRLAWLYRVTTNLCLTRLRDSARRRRILGTAPPSRGPGTDLPIDAALTVRALLRDIPEDMQEIAVAYFVDRLSQHEIAALRGLPRRTVGYRIEQFRARALSNAARHALASPCPEGACPICAAIR